MKKTIIKIDAETLRIAEIAQQLRDWGLEHPATVAALLHCTYKGSKAYLHNVTELVGELHERLVDADEEGELHRAIRPEEVQ